MPSPGVPVLLDTDGVSITQEKGHTAMTTAVTFAPAPIAFRPVRGEVLLGLLARARLGDEAALGYVFDNVFYDVYQEVFLDTRDRREAERVTRDAMDRLPRMLHSGRYGTVDEIRDSLVRQTRRRRAALRKAGAPAGGLEGLRAGIRHLVLISAALSAAAGALILAA
jgi:hypothetical protein